jgi:hypothetical protein
MRSEDADGQQGGRFFLYFVKSKVFDVHDGPVKVRRYGPQSALLQGSFRRIHQSRGRGHGPARPLDSVFFEPFFGLHGWLGMKYALAPGEIILIDNPDTAE